MLAPLNPGIDHVGPFLQHVTTLLLVLRLVIDAPRGSALLVRETLLNPIPIETELVQQGRAGAPQIVNGEWLRAASPASQPARPLRR